MIVRDPTPDEIERFRIRVPRIEFGRDRMPIDEANTATAWEPGRIAREGRERIRRACR